MLQQSDDVYKCTHSAHFKKRKGEVEVAVTVNGNQRETERKRQTYADGLVDGWMRDS